MKLRILSILSIFFFILLTGNFEQVFACMCGKASTCERYNYAAAIFVGKAVAIEEEKKGSWKTEATIFEIKETFFGENKKQIKVQNKSGFSCDIEFEKGETYLIFAGGNEKEGFGTGFCSGNLPLAYASQEITELRKIKSSPEIGKLTGSILEDFKRRDVYLNRVPFPNISLDIQEIETGKKYKTISDANGRYEIAIPSGKYKINPLIPDYAKLNLFFENDEIYNVNPRGCAEGFYVFSNKSQISGKVVDSEGKPVEDAVIELLSKDSNERTFRGEMNDHSEADGTFKITDIPVGKYTLSVNYTTAPQSDNPFPPVFYPNSPVSEQAQTIEINLETQVTNLEFKLPPRLAAKEINGKVFWDDNSPAQNVELILTDSEFPKYSVGCILKTVSKESIPGNSKAISVSMALIGCSPKTDNAGKFLLNGFSTRKYRVKASAEKVMDGRTIRYEVESDIFSVDEQPVELKLILKKKSVSEKE